MFIIYFTYFVAVRVDVTGDLFTCIVVNIGTGYLFAPQSARFISTYYPTILIVTAIGRLFIWLCLILGVSSRDNED
jgi:hypothetical protein